MFVWLFSVIGNDENFYLELPTMGFTGCTFILLAISFEPILLVNDFCFWVDHPQLCLFILYLYLDRKKIFVAISIRQRYHLGAD
jgi:hypothetical protein